MPAGRPTKYTKSLLEKAREYLRVYNNVKEGEEAPREVIPSHVGMAKYLDITTTCMYDWAKQEDKKEFSAILDECLRDQQQVLINKGLTGEFNSNITKLVLGKHGYHDKQDLGGHDGKPLIPETIKILHE